MSTEAATLYLAFIIRNLSKYTKNKYNKIIIAGFIKSNIN
jgi:hypothetical protein